MFDTSTAIHDEELTGSTLSAPDTGEQTTFLNEEVIVPEQFFTRSLDSAAHWTGERRLLFAVLQDAVDSLLRHRNARTTRGRRLLREDKEWFWSKERDRLFAFESICAYLGLEPDCIRQGLARLLEAADEPCSSSPTIQRKTSHPVRHLPLT